MLDVISNNQHRSIVITFLFIFFQRTNQKKNQKVAVLVSTDTFSEALKKLLIAADFEFCFLRTWSIFKKVSFLLYFVEYQNMKK